MGNRISNSNPTHLVVPLIVLAIACQACGDATQEKPQDAVEKPAATVSIAEPTTASTDQIEEESAASVSIAEPTSASTGQIEAEPTSTLSPPPTNTTVPNPAFAQEELAERWRFPIRTITLVTVVCQMTLETASEAEDLGVGELLGAILGIGAFSKTISEAIPEWSPGEGQAEIKNQISDHATVLQETMGNWLTDDDFTAAEVAKVLSPECESINHTTEDIGTAARAEGITEDTLASIVEEMEIDLAEIASTPEPTAAIGSPTPQPLGMSRSNPFPPSEVVSAPNWHVHLLEIVRSDEAWEAIQAANQFNDPAPEGMEYLLVKLHVKSTYADSEDHAISGSDFKVTGDRLIQYGSASVAEPDPMLDARLFTGGETEGWVAYGVGQGEGNLILIVDELLSFNEDGRKFIALEDGAFISVAPELVGIQPTDLGKARGSPAPFGETVITESWEVTILEMVRGDDAWEMVREVNQFNDPPEEGMEYIAANIQVRYIGTADDVESIDGSYFNTTGSANVLYDLPSVVDPSPALDVMLFPGGEYEGWVILQAAQGETDLMAVFEPWSDFSGENKRFMLLEP